MALQIKIIQVEFHCIILAATLGSYGIDIVHAKKKQPCDVGRRIRITTCIYLRHHNIILLKPENKNTQKLMEYLMEYFVCLKLTSLRTCLGQVPTCDLDEVPALRWGFFVWGWKTGGFRLGPWDEYAVDIYR